MDLVTDQECDWLIGKLAEFSLAVHQLIRNLIGCLEVLVTIPIYRIISGKFSHTYNHTPLIQNTS